MIHLKSPEEIEIIVQGGAIIAGLLRELEPRVQPGASTGELNRFCDEFICSHDGATPAFKGLYGFPGSVCTSLNEEVVHGIPSYKRILAEGDILSIDVGVNLGGWCSDSAWTFPAGEMDSETKRLCQVTEEALGLAIEAAQPGNRVGDIGAAVVRRVDATGFRIIRDLVGHGVGRSVHEEPQVPNIGKPGIGPELREGMVLAIEPMLSAGTPEIRTLADGWTVVTGDMTRSAHYEHTVAITREGPLIVTLEPARISGQAAPTEAAQLSDRAP